MLAPATAWALCSRHTFISFPFGSWTILFIFGHVRDFFRKRLGSAKENGYAPIRLGYEDFYVRRMYQRIQVRVDIVYGGWNTMRQIGLIEALMMSWRAVCRSRTPDVEASLRCFAHTRSARTRI